MIHQFGYIYKKVTAAFFLLPFFSGQVSAVEDKIQVPAPASPVSVADLSQLVLGLLLIVGLIFAISWALKRFSGFSTQANPNLKVLSGLHVGQKEKILLVQVAEKQLLIGVTPYSINTLKELEENIEITTEQLDGVSSFAEKLKQVMKREYTSK